MITGPPRYKPNISWPSLTGHFSNNIKVIMAEMGAAAEMFAAQREERVISSGCFCNFVVGDRICDADGDADVCQGGIFSPPLP